MKKTFTANINGIVFHIDEDAYTKLDHYLSTIRRHFTNDEGCEEIIAGIEGRIAEVFQERIGSQKQVVTISEVREVISQLGDPEQISDEADQADPIRKPGEAGKTDEKRPDEEKRYIRDPESTNFGSRPSKRLYRDPDDKYIGGVCAGLANYFDIDPVWMRIIFIISLFAGFGVFLYIILWIVVPKAVTPGEKLEMRGERVNLSNIERSIREDLDDIKRNLRNITEETRDAFKKKS